MQIALRRSATARVFAALVLGVTATLHAQDSLGPPRRAVVRGRVLAEGGQPIEAADVVIDSAWHTRTDADGRFRLAEIPVAVHLMEVRAIGFRPLALDLHVVRAEEIGLAINLEPAAQQLPELVATAHQRRLERIGYYARQATGQGRFLDGDSLARIDSTSFVWALSQVRGLHTLNPGGLDPLPASTACRGGFTLVLNGWNAPEPAFALRTLHPKDIEAVEVYEDAGIPNVSTAALQSQAASPPGTAALAVAATRWLIRRAERDDGWKKPTPTSCTLVVWERQ
jgi:hypothetical protein